MEKQNRPRAVFYQNYLQTLERLLSVASRKEHAEGCTIIHFPCLFIFSLICIKNCSQRILWNSWKIIKSWENPWKLVQINKSILTNFHEFLRFSRKPSSKIDPKRWLFLQYHAENPICPNSSSNAVILQSFHWRKKSFKFTWFSLRFHFLNIFFFRCFCT